MNTKKIKLIVLLIHHDEETLAFQTSCSKYVIFLANFIISNPFKLDESTVLNNEKKGRSNEYVFDII